METNINDFNDFENIHKGEPAVVIGHGPSCGTITKSGHKDGPDGFEYSGGWEKFDGIRISSHYKEYDSHYTVCAEWDGVCNERKWFQGGNEVKFVGNCYISRNMIECPEFNKLKTHIFVPEIPGFYYDNTGNLAWCIAYWMGCNPIYLAGLDFTLTDREPEYYLNDYMNTIYKDLVIGMCGNNYVQVYKTSKDGRLQIPVKNPLNGRH